MSGLEFCPRCDVTMDLHYADDPDGVDEMDCEGAQAKARTLDLFFAPFARGGRP